MTTHTLTSRDDLTAYGRRRFPHRLLIAGSDDTAGWGVMQVAAGDEGRRQHGGPMIPGPWADVWGMPGVIDNHGGSAADMRREDASGLLIRCEPGDVLVLDGERYTVEVSTGHGPPAGAGRGWYRRGYPILRHESEVPA